MNIKDKVWIVTGAASGIGKALGMAILKRGGYLAAVDLSAEKLSELHDSLHESIKKTVPPMYSMLPTNKPQMLYPKV